MPKILLTQQFSDNPPIVQHKTKTDYSDTRLTGFFLEVRASGKAGKPRYIPLSAQPHQDITPFCFGKTYPLTEPTPKGKIPP
jgi:hypothetical protein